RAAPAPTRPGGGRPAMAGTKLPGTSHSARPPSCQAKMPTVTIARMWSSPPSGWAKPDTNPCASPAPVCAKAAAGMSVRAVVIRPVRMVVPLSASKIIVLQKLHIGGVFDKSAHRPSAPPTRECLGAQTVAAHPGRRIGAGPTGWGAVGAHRGTDAGWMGAHAPITALRPEANGSGGIYRFFL